MSVVTTSRIEPAPPSLAGEPDAAPISRMPRLRDLCEGLVCLAMAVLVMRSFFVEGYMISTGSMAPALFGYHKRVVCPTCGVLFARGVAFDDSHSSGDIDASLLHAGEQAVCPNCGQSAINIAQVPRNHGDQLLVFKHLFRLRPPQRWEIAVFHNPFHPGEAFVKRIVGLPGEAIQIVDGNVYANGEICRKSLPIQRAMRIPVFKSEHAPPQPRSSAPHWIGGDGWLSETPGQFQFDPARDPEYQPNASVPQWSWLAYRHRDANSSRRVTSAAVTNLPLGFALPNSPPDSPVVQPVTFRHDDDEPDAGTLFVTGPLSSEWEERLRDRSANAGFQQAISALARKSRHPAITDDYGYNELREGGRNTVSDLMITGKLALAGEGQFAIEMYDDQKRFRLVFDTGSDTLSLLQIEPQLTPPRPDAAPTSIPDSRFPIPDPQPHTLQSVPLPAKLARGESVPFEMSVMDQQVLVAIDGDLAFPAWTYTATNPSSLDGAPPVRLGARGLTASVRKLNLYRDVYYTPGRRRNGIAKPYRLDDDEFFVLGDNSPISLDSRSWPDAAVPAKLLIGKPFVVHLPSRPATLQIGTGEFTVRVPDFSRMRYIE